MTALGLRWVDSRTRSCFDGDMTTNTCQCGCGEPTARRYRPGHDAKHKSALVTALSSNQWWTRERAAATLEANGWLAWAPAELLERVPERSRCRGRFVETRHLRRLQIWIVDARGDSHSHRSCPRIAGGRDRATDSDRQVGWACSTCIHTDTFVERAAQARHDAAIERAASAWTSVAFNEETGRFDVTVEAKDVPFLAPLTTHALTGATSLGAVHTPNTPLATAHLEWWLEANRLATQGAAA